ncbi:hypothetical protein OPV22_000744 [Ensete ventricosum]|uniref:Non-specific serine/threonine protein kinase n=1 Tax=Ensete ventricosum TaxID=4639 RepID=A0AAV8RV42_ENSVE|nr:hypothetical protein OPV22_000744 [Ensete ventricosum]
MIVVELFLVLGIGAAVHGQLRDTVAPNQSLSFDYPCDTLLPGMKLGITLGTNFDRYLTSWKSDSDPSPGDYTYKMDPYGEPEVYLQKDGAIIYRSGPWNGHGFSGRPEMQQNEYFKFELIANQDMVYYTFGNLNSSILSRIVLSSAGEIQRFVWYRSDPGWSLYWKIPRDFCDYYAKCGANGVCNTTSTPCQCLNGFVPKAESEWELRNFVGGCVRKTKLGCQSGDGFFRLQNLKLPDTSDVISSNRSLEDCDFWCLSNCSCTAYSIVAGRGCLTWTGDLIDIKMFTSEGDTIYVRFLVSDTGTTHVVGTERSSATTNNLSGARTERSTTTSDVSCDNTFGSGFGIFPSYNLSAIEAATCDFSNDSKLGEGAFGIVYKGQLGDGRNIAVKRMKHLPCSPDDFKNELLLISNFQHRNLVRLLGYCIEGNERMLILDGYMAAEYANYGIFSFKSDVFSFGVIVLEILSGKKNIETIEGDNGTDLIGHAYILWKQGRSLEILDDTLQGLDPPIEAMRFIRVGLLCVQENSEDRPTMAEVVTITYYPPITAMKCDAFVHYLNVAGSLEPAMDDPADEQLRVPDDLLEGMNCYVKSLDEAVLQDLVSAEEAAGRACQLRDEDGAPHPPVPKRGRGWSQRSRRRPQRSSPPVRRCSHDLMTTMEISVNACRSRYTTHGSLMPSPPSWSKAGRMTKQTRRKRKRREDVVVSVLGFDKEKNPINLN